MRTNIAFDISVGAITGQAQLTDVIAGSVSQGVVGALSGSSLQKVQNKLNSAFSDAYVTGAKAGLGVQNRMFKRQVASELAALEKRAKIWQSWQKKIASTSDAAQKKSMQRQADAVEREIAQRQTGIDRIIRRRENANEQYFNLLQKYEENAARTFSEKAGAAGEGFASAISSAMTLDSLDPSSLVTGMASAFEKAAPSLAAAGGKMAASGGTIGAVGSAVTALAGSAALIAGAAGSIAAVVAVFAAAYGQTKEMNKAILEGSSAMDLMSDASGDLSQHLGDVRKAAISTTGQFRIASEEVLGVLSGLNQAGVTFKEMRQTFGTLGDAQEAYSNIAATTITQMQVFGQSVDSVASSINFMMKDMGYGLESINDAFVTMYAGAKQSGMAVSDFYTAINEITSGMARMNFRLEDSVEMLLAMTEILGEDLAKEVSQYTGKFKEMGFTERMKTTMVAGKGGREILAGQATKQGEELAKSIQEAGMEMAIVSRGLGKMVGGKLQIDTESMGKLTGTALGALQNELGGALGTRAGGFAELARGAGAKSTLGQRAGALANLDAQGEMAMEMVGAFAVLGNKRLDEMEGLNRAAFEDITGVSGNMFEAYQDISRRVGAQLETQGKGTGAGGAVTMMDVAKAIQEGDLLSDADRAAMRESQEAGMTEMEKLARAQLKETTSISTDIKNKIVSILESANGFLEALVDLTDVGWENESTKRAKRKATAALQVGQLSDLAEQLSGEMESYRKSGGDLGSEEYKAMEKKQRDVSTAQEALRRSQYTATGEITSEGGKALSGLLGTDTSTQKLAQSGLGRFIKTIKAPVYSSSKDTQRLVSVGEYGVKEEFYQDPKAVQDLADKQGKSLQDQLKSTVANQKTAENTKESGTQIRKLVEFMRTETSRKALSELSGGLGKSEEEIAKIIKEGGTLDTSALGESGQSAYRWLTANRKKAGLSPNPMRKHDDFFYQGGVITPVNPNDTLMGAKPRVDGGRSGMGGARVVNININGGNPSEVYRVVRLASKARR